MVQRFTLAKACLFTTADFEFLFKTGNKKFGSFFVVYSCPISAENDANIRRFGFVVSKKATGNNVKRNLVKRIIREIYRLNQYQLHNQQILVVTKKNLPAFDRVAIREDLCKLFKKV